MTKLLGREGGGEGEGEMKGEIFETEERGCCDTREFLEDSTETEGDRARERIGNLLMPRINMYTGIRV